MSHPPYAARWISQWRSAAVELQRVRDAQLRQSAQPAGEVPGSPPVEAQSGLVQQQAWFRRWHLLHGTATGGRPDGTSITTCSAEDLIVHKAFAARAQDWIDIRGILVRNSSQLDRQLVLDELAPLVELKEEPEILTQLMRMVEVTE